MLVEAFRTGQDIHARTAQEVFGVGPMAQNAEHRRAAKAINFGIIYGQTPFGLAAQLGIDQKEAAQFIAAYFARYRGVKEYLERSLAEARKTGVTRTLFGRIRPVPEITSPQANLRNFAERTALNTPLQGTAADLIKLAMIAIASPARGTKVSSENDSPGPRRIAVRSAARGTGSPARAGPHGDGKCARARRAARGGLEGRPELARHEVAQMPTLRDRPSSIRRHPWRLILTGAKANLISLKMHSRT